MKEYKIATGTSFEIGEKVNKLLAEGFCLYGNTFMTGRRITSGHAANYTRPEHPEFAQVLIRDKT